MWLLDNREWRILSRRTAWFEPARAVDTPHTNASKAREIRVIGEEVWAPGKVQKELEAGADFMRRY